MTRTPERRTPERRAPVFIVSDTGGTNTRLGISHGPTLCEESVVRLKNADYPDFDTLLSTWLKTGLNTWLKTGLKTGRDTSFASRDDIYPDAICAALAGPVEGTSGVLTNLNWSMSTAGLMAKTGAKSAYILNDLAAQGWALDDVSPDHIQTVFPKPMPAGAGPCGDGPCGDGPCGDGPCGDGPCGDGPCGQEMQDKRALVIGVGTGFNTAAVVDAGGRRLVNAAESGHMSLPVLGPKEQALAAELLRDTGFASVEDILSGAGIALLDHLLNPQNPRRDTAAVFEAAAAGEARAIATTSMAATLLGRVAGDLALTHLPDGGIHLIGGVARGLAPWMTPAYFGAGFGNKGRFSDFMQKFKVSLVTDDFAALRGAARFLMAQTT